MEQILNFQVPAEGLELVILLHFLLKAFFQIFTFKRNINFSEKMLSEGLELVIHSTKLWGIINEK